MNVFILHEDPITAARMHCDKHVPKMIVESEKMISKGFDLVTVGSDQRFMSAGAKNAIEKIKGKKNTSSSEGY